jgi:hypothetical protein
MNVWLQGALVGAVLAVILIFFEYTAITREVAEKSKRIAKKVEWDSNQKSRMRGMMTFGAVLPVGCAVGAWLISKM